MAFLETSRQFFNDGAGDLIEYICASTDDIANLPTEAASGGPRPGSLALIETDASVYILKTDREWAKLLDGVSS